MKGSTYIALTVGILTLIGLALPLSAAAEQVTVSTVQAIPPGGSSCAPLQVLNVHPYTENNTLQSFDVTVNDSAYYVVLNTVGDTSYTFRYVSRWHNQDGSIRQHVDVQTTPIGSSLPITLTLLSAKTGEPVCLSVIHFSVQGTGPVYTPPPVTRVPPVSIPTVPVAPATTTSSSSTSSTSSSSTVSVVRGVGIGSLSDVCTQNGSLQLWFLLITLYLIGAAVIALREPTVPARSLTITMLLLVIPALILLTFWLFAATCRGASWVPFVVFVIAAASILAALWEREPITAARMVELAPIPKKELLPEPPRTV